MDGQDGNSNTIEDAYSYPNFLLAYEYTLVIKFRLLNSIPNSIPITAGTMDPLYGG